ncbi:MAG: hypothetical protein AAGG75_07685, partial [Bacteroidota bacterium]
AVYVSIVRRLQVPMNDDTDTFAVQVAQNEWTDCICRPRAEPAEVDEGGPTLKAPNPALLVLPYTLS